MSLMLCRGTVAVMEDGVDGRTGGEDDGARRMLFR